MTRRKKAFLLGFGAVVAWAFLVALHAVPAAWEVRAGEVNRLFNVAGAWCACAALFAAAAAVGRGARIPWRLLGVALALVAFAETVTAYFVAIKGEMVSLLWLLNVVFLGAYVVTIVALFWKAKSLPFTIRPVLKPILIVVVTAVFAHVFYEVILIISASSAMPAVAKALMLVFPVADYLILVLAAYVYASYGRGLAGRPWMVVALGVLFIALSDLLGGYAAAGESGIYARLALIAQFAGYVAIAWGAWYQRAMLKDPDA